MTNPHQRLMTTWKSVLASIKAFSRGVEVRPSQGVDIFKQSALNSADNICFDVSPVVFKIPERTNHSTCDMFVVISGHIKFPKPGEAAEDRTCGFGTQVAYFRNRPKHVDHTCGLHYDFEAKLIAHPIFHAQFAPLAYMSRYVRSHMRRDNWEDGENCMRGVISTVRLPTAQMDFFSVALQLCADHLVNCNSDQSTQDKFYSLRRDIAQSMLGSCYDHPGLKESIGKECLRGPHWYLPAAFVAPTPSGSGGKPIQSGRSSPSNR